MLKFEKKAAKYKAKLQKEADIETSEKEQKSEELRI